MILLLPVGLEPSSLVLHEASLAAGLVVLFHPLLTVPLVGGGIPFLLVHLLSFLPLLFVESPFRCLLALKSPIL